jgi:hypothetical protein
MPPRADRQSVWPESVTHVSGMKCYLCLRNRPSKVWRRERDSNPRNGFPFSGFQDHRHRPLGHPSAPSFYSELSELTDRSIVSRPDGTGQPAWRGSFAEIRDVFSNEPVKVLFRLQPCGNACARLKQDARRRSGNARFSRLSVWRGRCDTMPALWTLRQS